MPVRASASAQCRTRPGGPGSALSDTSVSLNVHGTNTSLAAGVPPGRAACLTTCRPLQGGLRCKVGAGQCAVAVCATARHSRDLLDATRADAVRRGSTDSTRLVSGRRYGGRHDAESSDGCRAASRSQGRSRACPSACGLDRGIFVHRPRSTSRGDRDEGPTGHPGWDSDNPSESSVCRLRLIRNRHGPSTLSVSARGNGLLGTSGSTRIWPSTG